MANATPTMDASQAQGAQIPLQNFKLPVFPREAGGLMALTLTSDIKLDEYSEILKNPPFIPQLPNSIQSLTLELFSLGYPPGFLTSLIKELPNLKTLVLYSQLIAGVSPESKEDAVQFFGQAQSLRSLHFLDVFAQPHFIQEIAPKIKERERGLIFLEINYTSRHEDELFLERVSGLELPLLISPSLITCSLNVSVPDLTDDPNDPANLVHEVKEESNRDGVLSYAQDDVTNAALIKCLTAEESAPRALKLLNITLYTISLAQLQALLQQHKGLLVLSVTVELPPTDDAKKILLKALSACKRLEQFEILFNLGPEEVPENVEEIYYTKEDMNSLSTKCSKLNSFKANIMRRTNVQSLNWSKLGDEWDGGVVAAAEKPDKEVKKKADDSWSPWT
ncbi:Phosphoribosylaminoimidazole-succinocarboxamide synthase [Venturia nashicola]|nr:Phosphoribosylaminoimidazole-succinocarboxamide synthase [Venturia nashicola]